MYEDSYVHGWIKTNTWIYHSYFILELWLNFKEKNIIRAKPGYIDEWADIWNPNPQKFIITETQLDSLQETDWSLIAL